MSKAVCTGEMLIDFTPYGASEAGMPLYEMNPGGACANVACTLARFGVDTAFVGKLGRDYFGEYLVRTLREQGVNTAGVLQDGSADTTLAFVHLAADGDRSFHFVRSPGADTCLLPADVPADLVSECDIFHFGSIPLTDNPSRDTILACAEEAKAAGKLVSFDPNLREPLWESLELAKATMIKGMSLCNVLKVSEEELYFLTGIDDVVGGTEYVYNNYHIPMILATLGKRGVYFHTPYEKGHAATYAEVETIDTTGAGDIFVGSFLYQVAAFGLDNLKGDNIRLAVDFANAAASLSTTRKGAIPSIPQETEVRARMSYRG